MILSYFLVATFFGISLASSLLSLENSVITISNDIPKFHITAKDAAIESITLKQLSHISGEVITSNQLLEEKKGKYIIPISKESPDIGVYKIQLQVKSKGGSSEVEVLRGKLVTQVEISTAKVLGESMKYPDKFAAGKRLAVGEKFAVTVGIKDLVRQKLIEPHQAFLVFTHIEKKTTVYFVLKAVTTNHLKTILDINMEGSSFNYQSGIYNVQLLFGDAGFEKSLQWDLGQIKLILPAAPIVAPAPLYAKTLLHESDTTLKALPEIEHIMRIPDTRPPKIISYFFTLLTIIPFFGYLIFISRSGLKIKLPEGSGKIFAFGFLASLASIFGLFVLYWAKLSMFCTLGYLVPLGASTIVFGHQALRQHAEASCSSTKKKTE